MADTDFCLACGKTIGMWDKECKHCGANQFGENDEFYPDEKSIRTTKMVLGTQRINKSSGILKSIFSKKTDNREKEPIFSQEECFLYGIHPDDEMYRKAMEIDILSKNYK